MSTDKVTTEQRKGIHDRAKSMGYHEGTRAAMRELASIEGPKIGRLSVYAAGIVIDAFDDDERMPQRNRFNKVDWHAIDVETLDDLCLLTDAEIAAAQPDPQHEANFVAGVSKALEIFNLKHQ